MMMFDAMPLAEMLAGVGAVGETAVLFHQLAAAYSQPDRHYHNQAHIAACLQLWQQHRSLAQQPAEIAVAIWFHDAVYDAQRQDNEEQSAAWAQTYLSEQQVAPERIERIVGLIMATKTHESLPTTDQQLLVDIDLAILGQDPATFAAYDAAIRREYGWVADEAYRTGRTDVLTKFLQRAYIYQTAVFQATYEKQARINLANAINKLVNS